MIKTVTIFKRGQHLTGTIYKDSNIKDGRPFYAEVQNDKDVVRSPFFVDEDVAMSWIESQFENVISRRFVRAN